jgi:hypothetical protein
MHQFKLLILCNLQKLQLSKFLLARAQANLTFVKNCRLETGYFCFWWFAGGATRGIHLCRQLKETVSESRDKIPRKDACPRRWDRL